MCGIFGYIGEENAVPILVEGLKTLEYRGYDSAGIFVHGHGVVKAVGPIVNLEKEINKDWSSNVGIAHTRWATHGEPTIANAHPHKDMSGKIWLVHNGIIENYHELKEGLIARGVKFYSNTDTEVLVKLIGSFYSGDIVKATKLALKSVRGTYGVAVTTEYEPKKIVVARMGSPIVIGVGKNANYISSDPSALLKHTKEVVYLNDGEVAVLTKEGFTVSTVESSSILKKLIEIVDWSYESVQKNGYEHYMLKEIFEAPQVIEDTIRGRLILQSGTAKLGGLERVSEQIKHIERLHIIGCGSAYYAGGVGRYMLEEYARMPVEIELASEYRYKKTYKDKKSAALFVSQSGETADSLASLEKVKSMDMLTLGMVNVVGSSIARRVDAGIYNHAGPEVAVASTKAFLSQLTAFVLITLFLGRQRGMTKEEGVEIVKALQELPEVIKKVLATSEEIKKVAKKYANYRDFMYIGRTNHSAIAYEGALKLKEVSYIHAEAYAGGELKHGPIAMLDKNFPVLAIVPKNDVYEKMISNIEEVKARSAPMIALATEGDLRISDLVDDVLYMPKVHPLIQPIVSTIPLQLFAYYIGVEKGLNVDRPRNLAKSVTVE